MQMWSDLCRRGPSDAALSADVSAVGIRPKNTGQGIFRDKNATSHMAPDGVTLSLLDIGDVYDDAFDEAGGRYYYPQTKRPPGRDQGEVEATKNAARLGLPLFVVLRSKEAGRRSVRMALIKDWDDDRHFFEVQFVDPQTVGSPAPWATPEVTQQSIAEAVQQALQARSQKRYKPAAVLCAVDMVEDGASPDHLSLEELARRFDDRVGAVEATAVGKAWEPVFHLSVQSAGPSAVWELRAVGKRADFSSLSTGRPKSQGALEARADTAALLWPFSDALVTAAGRGEVRRAVEAILAADGLSAGPEPPGATRPPGVPTPLVMTTPVERFTAGEASVANDPGPRVAVRRESALRQRYVDFLTTRGHAATGLRITPPGTLTLLSVDLFDETLGRLIEAKADASRESVRMAIGQLLDYARWIEPRPALAVLLPDRPADDLVELLGAVGVTLVCERDGEFFEETA